ncbi:MAG: hypothetical protein K0R62_7364 [Nonomuraea muscovyensis]|nr:hypothetical protein [Nonomuraea muscovyensis]
MVGRHSLELALPGATIGAAAGAMAGGLTLPLALFGGLYGVLLGEGLLRHGTFGPSGLYWMAAFPLSRLFQDGVAGPGTTEGVGAFLAFQAMVSLGFALGFVWVHERLMPHWLLRRATVNPRAAALLETYVRHAQVTHRRKGARR